MSLLREYEFFETPAPFVRYLFAEAPIGGGVCVEPCVGSGAIIRAAPRSLAWVRADLDRRWPADVHGDATAPATWQRARELAGGRIAWTVTNPPFTHAADILALALRYSTVGVAMHVRASFHEPLKKGPRQTFLTLNPPTGILWLPRVAYQRSPTTGKWTTDSLCATWAIWLRAGGPQFIRYAPGWVADDLRRTQREYRARMDQYLAIELDATNAPTSPIANAVRRAVRAA